MKMILIQGLVFLGLNTCLGHIAACRNAGNNQDTVAVFAAHTACNAFIRKLIMLPDGVDCEKIQWRLTLLQDAKGIRRYHAVCVYGMQENSAPGFVGGGQTVQQQGQWLIEKGTATDANAVVYKLYNGTQNSAILLVKMDDNILHFLYSDRHLLIGNAAWGYTLNRIHN